MQFLGYRTWRLLQRYDVLFVRSYTRKRQTLTFPICRGRFCFCPGPGPDLKPTARPVEGRSRKPSTWDRRSASRFAIPFRPVFHISDTVGNSIFDIKGRLDFGFLIFGQMVHMDCKYDRGSNLFIPFVSGFHRIESSFSD